MSSLAINTIGGFFRIFVTGYIRKLKYFSLFSLLYISVFSAFAQPANDECANAIEITDARKYCSGNGQYNNLNASPSFIGTGNDVWFKFTARNFEVKVTVNGAPTNGSLQSPVIFLYNECGGTQRTVQTIQDGNTSILTSAGLVPGNIYYIGISGANNRTGTFKLCIENYQSEIKAGQDFSGASLICSIESIIREVNISGAGLRPNEALGSCLDVQPGIGFSETNSAWYKWTAANDGTLVFTITPSKRDDIDWVLYELGPESNTQNTLASNAIRCAAGEGINQRCANEATYVQTGLDFSATDLSEASGCGTGQDGVTKFITMKKGFVYALLVNNASAGNNGFEIAFTDKAGKAGTGLFKGPSAKIKKVENNLCLSNPSYTFSSEASDFTNLQWYFGEGASIAGSTNQNPGTITYNTSGLKTVVLQLKNNAGCSIVQTETFMHVIKPDAPKISGLQTRYCVGDTISLKVDLVQGATYSWTGPAGFSASTAEIKIPVDGVGKAGVYVVNVSLNGCTSDPASVNIASIGQTPTAAYRSEPKPPAKLSFPVRIRFFNESIDADAFFWNFGDGNTSTDRDPEHTYRTDGNFDVSLTVFKSSVCSASTTQGQFIISANNILFIPNTFTPNNDALNDEFVISMTNIKTYKIQIFNRFGVLLFVSEDLFNHWNGNFNNKPSPLGTYYYLIEASDFNGNIIKKTGSVTILR